MNDRVQQWLADIYEAITAIASHLARDDLSTGWHPKSPVIREALWCG